MPKHTSSHGGSEGNYLHFALMIVLSFVAMFWLMYAMVDTPGNVYVNVNQLYMAALMTAPMVVLELLLMRHMYPRRALNLGLLVGAILLAIASWFGIRHQAAVTDSQFLRSMIPHHAGAILMCEQSELSDARLRELCEGILRSQSREIELMRSMLKE